MREFISDALDFPHCAVRPLAGKEKAHTVGTALMFAD